VKGEAPASPFFVDRRATAHGRERLTRMASEPPETHPPDPARPPEPAQPPQPSEPPPETNPPQPDVDVPAPAIPPPD